MQANPDYYPKSRVRKHISDGLIKAELHSLFCKILEDCGYSGFEMGSFPYQPKIIFKVTNFKPLLDDHQRRMRQITAIIHKRQFDFRKDYYEIPYNKLQIKFQRMKQRGLCAATMAESIKLKLLAQMPVRAAVSAAIRQIVDKDKAKGCEIIVSGKLSQQRAKSMKFKKGYMVSSGQAKNGYIQSATRHVLLKQGVMGVKVRIMKEYDPNNIQCSSIPLPDHVQFLEINQGKEEKITTKIVNAK